MVNKSKNVLSLRRDVEEAHQEADDTDNQGDDPLLPVRKFVAYDGDDATGEGGGAADTQGEQHQEEHSREELRSERESRQDIRVTDERQGATASFQNIFHFYV